MNKSRSNKRKKKRRSQLEAAATDTLELCAGGSVEIQAAEGEDGPGNFSMVAYTGRAMRPGGWRKEHPLVLRISGMESPSKIPVHRDHDSGRIVGHADHVVADANGVSVSGVLSADNEHTRDVRAASRNGFPWQSSVGANLIGNPRLLAAGKKEVINGHEMTGPLYVAERWKLKEASFVSLGADEATSAVAASEEKIEMADNVNVEAKDVADVTAGETTTVVEKPIQASETPDVVAQMRSEAAKEAQRLADIAAKFAEFPELKATAITEGWSGDKLELELVKAKAAKLEEIRDSRSTGPAIHAHSSEELMDCDVVAARIHKQAYPQHSDDFLAAQYGEQAVEASARLPKQVGLQYLCALTIKAAGGHVDPYAGFSSETFKTAVQADRRLRANADITAASGFSTFSLSGTLSNLANKSLMAVYNEWPSLVSRICSTVVHNDFKQHKSHRIEGDLELDRLPPTGEINLGTLGEETYTNQVYAYAKRFAIDMQTFIDDDLNAFAQMGTHIGNAAMRTREKLLFTTILNPASVGAFFVSTASANKTNHLTTTTLNEAGLQSAKTLLRSMKSTEGNPTMIQPDFVLTSVDHEEEALKLLNYTTIRIVDDNVAAGSTRTERRVQDQFKGRFGLEVSPWLDTGSGVTGALNTTWFLFGDKTSGGAYEYASLAGQDAPMMQTEDTDFSTWGFQSRAIWSFGFAERLPEAVVRVDA